MDRPLRLIAANPVDRLARVVEALLVIASQPLSVEDLADAANEDADRIETALRLLATEPPSLSLGHMALRFPPVSLFLERFRAVLRRRRRFDFDSEVGGLSRVEAAVAFLAVLDLRKAGEVSLDQASSFAPIRVTRAGVEQEQEWIARSA